MLDVYGSALLASALIVLMAIVQSLVATAAHRGQKDAVPGIVDETLSHGSFVFRSHRTFMNTLETVPLMLIIALIAMAAGVGPALLGWIMWIYLAARVAHMALYYAIATEQNPSPRSWFYLIGLGAQLVLIVTTIVALL